MDEPTAAIYQADWGCTCTVAGPAAAHPEGHGAAPRRRRAGRAGARRVVRPAQPCPARDVRQATDAVARPAPGTAGRRRLTECVREPGGSRTLLSYATAPAGR